MTEFQNEKPKYNKIGLNKWLMQQAINLIKIL